MPCEVFAILFLTAMVALSTMGLGFKRYVVRSCQTCDWDIDPGAADGYEFTGMFLLIATGALNAIFLLIYFFCMFMNYLSCAGAC